MAKTVGESNLTRLTLKFRSKKDDSNCRLPKMSREEIQKMLLVDDIRKTKVYQEALAEGKLEGELKGKLEGKLEGVMEEKRRMVRVFAAQKMPIQEIAKLLKLKVKQVREQLENG